MVPADAEGSQNPIGIAQARLVAARLRGMPVTFSSLVSSTMPRARQNAAFVGQSVPGLVLEATPLLCECTPRKWNAGVMKREKPLASRGCWRSREVLTEPLQRSRPLIWAMPSSPAFIMSRIDLL